MPELPEVETVKRGLAPHLVGARLVRVVAHRPDLRFPLPDRLVARLTGARVEALERRAKYLLARLDTGETLVAHLGMTGRFLVGSGQPGAFRFAAGADPKHTHLVFHTSDGAEIAYNDARRFGYVDLIETEALSRHPWFAGLGPEPLGDLFTPQHLGEAFSGRSQAVKTALLDQRIVAGLGNIYVCEVLFRSGVDPRTPAGEISRARVRRLVSVVREVLTEAIAAGGSTLRDFRDADGALGYFQHSFRIYGREDEPCLKPKCCGVVRRIVQGGRSTFFCETCQT